MDMSKKTTINYNDCKVGCHRLDKEIFRLCPTKLTKRELEDLYYELTDANICLKKTINSQQDKIKMLSTKLLRMSAVQRVYSNKDSGCCSNVKIIVEQQKDCISELKRANDRLAEKVRQLNTKLCSAKQFLKKSPYHSTPRSKKTLSSKLSASSLNTKQSGINIREVSHHNHDLDMPSPIVHETETVNRQEISPVKEEVSSTKEWENSKYSTDIEELRQTISKLQLQIAETTQENTEKLFQFEQDLSKLKEDNLQLRVEKNEIRKTLKSKSDECRKCNMKLRDLETQCNDLTVELSLSKRRVSEMETRAKSAELSDQLSKTIELHLANESQRKNQLMATKEFYYRDDHRASLAQSLVHKVDISTSPRKKSLTDNANCTKDDKLDPKLEDSGFNEPVGNVTTTDDGKELLRLNQDLIQKLAHLQNQLDSLQTSTIKPQQPIVHQDVKFTKTPKETILSNKILQNKDSNDEDDDDEIPEDIEVTNTGFGHSTPIKTDSKPNRKIEDEPTGNYSDDFDASHKESAKSKEISVKSLRNDIRTSPKGRIKSPSKIDLKTNKNKEVIPKAINAISPVENVKASTNKANEQDDIERIIFNSETYSVKKSAKSKGDKVSVKSKKEISSDDTENDVSSLTSIDYDDKHTKHILSLGERRISSGYSGTDSPCTSGDFHCLSEGEVLLGQRLSVGESPLYKIRNNTQRTKQDGQPLSKSIEGTLQAITKELNLCGKLLNIRSSAEVK